MRKFSHGLAIGIAALTFALCLICAGSHAETVLRLIAQADLTVLDPVYSTANITSNHGYMVYDQLFTLDSKFVPRPQMVDTYEKTADGLIWKFKLRNGLRFSDGSPVEGKDVVASIKRWAARHAAGRTMMTHVSEIVATGGQSFEIRFREIFGPVLNALAEPETPLFIMREEEAKTEITEQVKNVVGSGPFLFVKEEWRPANKVVYKRNPTYLPRNEPADGFAGGRVVKVDRVEWLYIPDMTVAIQALINGEADIMEIPPTDLLPLLEKAPNVVLKVIDRIGTQAMIRPNHLIAPFDNPKARQALLYIVGDQEDTLSAMVGRADLEVPCWAVFVCGTPLASDAGIGDWAKGDRKGNLVKARQLLEQSGYSGAPIVVMDPTDQAIIHKAVLVFAQGLHDIGANVDLQAMDWNTMVARRAIKDPPEANKGGWNAFSTWGGGIIIGNPLANPWAASPCDGKNYFGWPCDEELEKTRLEFVTASGVDRDAAVRRYQTRFYETVPYVLLGQYLAPIAFSKNLTGVLDTPRLVLWNIAKN